MFGNAIIVCLIAFFPLLILPGFANANYVHVDQEHTYLRQWEEHRYIEGKDFLVISHLTYDVHLPSLENVSYLSFIFDPFEPGNLHELQYFNVTVYEDCQQVSLQYKSLPIINCRNQTPKEVSVIREDRQYWVDTRNISIRLPDQKENWNTYDILIEYRIPDFIKQKFDVYYYYSDKACLNSRTENNVCPAVIQEDTIIDNKNALVDRYPDSATVSELLDGSPLIYYSLEGDKLSRFRIEYSDTSQTGLWNPLVWLVAGILLDRAFENRKKISKFIFDKIKLLKNRFLAN